jgi:ferredoxin-NADP reductase/ferredoxin
MPDIIAVTRDDIELRFPCAATRFVLDAAEDAGLYLPSVCRHGRCGTCWATVLSGSYELAPFEAKAQPAAPGAVLLCRCRPREDMVVQLPCRDAQIGRHHVPERRATLVAVSDEGQGWAGLSLRLTREGEYGQEAAFVPGQFIELLLPGTAQWQAMAMTNLPNDEGILEFLLRPAPDSALQSWLAAARRGAELHLRGPLGRFALDDRSPRPRCLVAADAGLAPFLAMLRQLAAGRDRTRLHVIYEAPKAARALAEGRLTALRAALPQLTFAVVADAPSALRTQLEKLPDVDLYACGPAPLLAAVVLAGGAHGVPETWIRTENLPGLRDEAAILTGP